ncbi:MAG: MFS transporter [Gammaproteobacteria bacterium]|nr:MFS transporter [Gammaproteobacteria bacterium]NIM71876.1 MFS transporter [Gammaproteobacteria bacterium]NIN37998.1 MFS transporter [Gammaproteobacteria bacterium]NIO23632.1 MFS transporter [Gammaproteobacteria bacterium]NIO64248.1 MFS transporter [Gammaproteobacteria bacterium]
MKPSDGRPVGRQTLSWALYDWANSAFATTVLAGFFPLFFKKYWSAGSDVTVSTFQLGVANATASLAVAALAPILGAIADRSGARKRYLLLFAGMGIVMTGCLALVAQGQWPIAVFIYLFALIGFSGANVFYDALLLDAAPHGRIDRVSALGFALGYLGGGVLFSFNVILTLYPTSFGLPDATAAVKVSFVSVAIWWAVFSIPLVVSFREIPLSQPLTGWAAVKAGFSQLSGTFQALRHMRVVFLFLIAYWLYIDGVHTIIRMAMDYALAIGLNSNRLIVALLLTQFVGFPAALAFGRLGDRIGAKPAILAGLGVYVFACVWGYFMRETWEFFVLAGLIGLVMGGVQALSRALYARLIPANKSGEFFGFYNMLGKFAAILGPLIMGVVSVVTGEPRLSILAVIVLFVAGGALLLAVNEREGVEHAHALARV